MAIMAARNILQSGFNNFLVRNPSIGRSCAVAGTGQPLPYTPRSATPGSTYGVSMAVTMSKKARLALLKFSQEAYADQDPSVPGPSRTRRRFF